MNGGLQSVFQFDLSGGHLALDLANTISRREDPKRRREHLSSFADVVSFAVQDGIVSPRHAAHLRLRARRQPAEASRAFRKAIALRETAYRVFGAIAQSRLPRPQDLMVLGEYSRDAVQHRKLVKSDEGFRWEWQAGGKNALDRIIWPITQAAVDLLTSDELKLVRWCEAPDCQWLFLDHSRNRSRRWCEMKSCGNRAKARRHYKRTHE